MAEPARLETRHVVELGEDVSGTLDAVLREGEQRVELPGGAYPFPRLAPVAATPAVDGPPVMGAPEQHGGNRRKEQVAPRREPDLEAFELVERRVGARQALPKPAQQRRRKTLRSRQDGDPADAGNLRFHQSQDGLLFPNLRPEPQAPGR